eukprot:3871572-Prymnesium_polylepis.1
MLVEGGLLQLHLRLREDGTEFVLLAAYMPPRCAIDSLVTEQEREYMETAWTALHKAAAGAQAGGAQVLVARDLNAESWQARQRWGGRPAAASDDELDMLRSAMRSGRIVWRRASRRSCGGATARWSGRQLTTGWRAESLRRAAWL